jgi:hypothetical protein
MKQDDSNSTYSVNNTNSVPDRSSTDSPTGIHASLSDPSIKSEATWLSSLNEGLKLFIKEKIKLSDKQLSPLGLSYKLFNELESLGFINLKKKAKPHEDQEFLIYKKGINSVMFVPQACNDVEDRNSNQFRMSGGYGISDALTGIIKSPEYLEAKKDNKKIEIHIPLALTRAAYWVKRAHWVTAIINEENKQIDLNILDSMESSLGYDFSHLAKEIQDFTIKVNESSNSPKNEETKFINRIENDYEVIDSPDIGFDGKIKNTYTGDQGLMDHYSCGYFVARYQPICSRALSRVKC